MKKGARESGRASELAGAMRAARASIILSCHPSTYDDSRVAAVTTARVDAGYADQRDVHS